MNDKFDKFTERARKVLSLAQEEAQRFNHNYIGTEHLLLGLVREGEGVGGKVLTSLGIELSQVRAAVERIIGRGDRIVLGEIGLTPRAKEVIELAVDEARRLNHHYVGTEHLLLGLVREGEGIAAGVLESLGVDLERLRAATIQALGQVQVHVRVAQGPVGVPGGRIRFRVPGHGRAAVYGPALRPRPVERATVMLALLSLAVSLAYSFQAFAGGVPARMGVSATTAALTLGGAVLIQGAGLLLASHVSRAGYAICAVAGAMWAAVALVAPSAVGASNIPSALSAAVFALGLVLTLTSLASLVARWRLEVRLTRLSRARLQAHLPQSQPPPASTEGEQG